MDWFARAFLKASLVWLVAGVTLGIAMAVRPELLVYRPVHLHLTLLGFVAMMIFGFAYNAIPHFAGHPLHSRRLATGHWWLANGGLVLLAGGFALLPRGAGPARMLLGAGGALSALGAYAFAYNIWRTIDAGRAAALARQPSARGRRMRRVALPVLDP